MARKQIESVAAANEKHAETREKIQLRYGKNLYKCPRVSCRYFTDGFASQSEQKKHSDRHERPYRCEDEQCHGYQVGFALESQLTRHMTTTHPDSQLRNLLFPTDNEVAQSVERLRLEAVPPRPPTPVVIPEPESESEPEAPLIVQPKQYTREAKRLKTNEFSCVHCGKNFRKRWNWQSHLATHEGGEQLICDTCGKSCARPSDLTRHIRAKHSGVKAYICDGCGKRFTRKDILQSHHRSKKGRRCVVNIDTGEQSSSQT
jgi:uncharacterized C2H2 Zn-finger protein